MNKSIFFFLLSFLFIIINCKSSTHEKNLKTNLNSNSDKISESYEIKLVAKELYVPWSIVFTDSNRMLINERDGKMRVLLDNQLIEKPLKVFEGISEKGEEGLMGLALDPKYKDNKFLYVSYAYDKGQELSVRVVRFKDEGDRLTGEKIIIDNLPAERYHAGCRLRFGPDGKLYITTGDAGERELVQDTKNLYGKILRLNADGTIPEDNPFPGNPVWSYGHRNSQGIDWYPGTNILYETEHGPSGFDGPGGGDEVNIIIKGGNYGWPVVSHNETKSGMISPELEFTPAIAPASGMFYKSAAIPQFKNNFFFGCLRGSGIMRVIVDEKNPEKIISYEKLKEVNFGRIRDIAEGYDGAIYFSTSNRDGRGNISEGDDKIYKIVKKN